MGISTNLVSGLSSGFDWRSMIDQLIAIEHKRVDLVEDQISEYESELSAWQSFNTSLLSLKTAAEGLKDTEDFYLYSSSMSTDDTDVDAEDLLSVSSSSTAAPGTYAIKVTNLAKAQKLSSNPFTSRTAELGSNYAGDITINGKVVTISATDTLSDVAYIINSANTGTEPSKATASIVNYGTNDYRLILTGDTTGADGISLLNGSSTNLVQKFGWKDNETAAIKNSITDGAQSDRFTTHNVAIKSLLGLSTGEVSTGTLKIEGIAVTIDLSSDSLTDIKTAINDEGIAGVTASIISQTEDGSTYYRLQIDGTQTFVDENNILNTLGVLDHNSADVTGKVSGNAMTSEGASITPDTLLVDIDGYNTFTAGGSPGGDYITLTGDDTDGIAVGPIIFNISSSTTAQDFLDEIETRYGDVIAYITSEGKIRVDDLTGGANLDVNLADHIHDGNSSLEFVNLDASFADGSSRKREIIAGEDATVEIDGVEVTDSTNVIDDVIAGVTLNLATEDNTTTVSLNIERDISAVKTNIQGFVSNYNTVMSYINTQFTYDEDSEETGGVLFGDSTLRSVKSDMTSLISEGVWGVDSDFSVLSLVGVSMDSDLLLSIDDSTLTGYLQTNFTDMMSLFVGQGTSSSSAISYVGHSRDSQAGEYDIHINRAATRGTETGSIDLSAGGADETLTITQGNSTAVVTITNGMTTDDIVNEINTNLDTEYTQAVVGDSQVYSDNTQTNEITSETTWDTLYDSGGGQLIFNDSDTITFSGTSRNGSAISGNYEIGIASSDKVQGLLSAIEDAFQSKATASIDTSGRIIVTDIYSGTSQLSIDSINHTGEGAFFGTIDVTSGAGDGSEQGRYTMDITALDDGSDHLVLRSDNYGNTSFTISQDTTDNNYNFIRNTTSVNTTDSTSGTVNISESTAWNDISGASLAVGDKIVIGGLDRDGVTPISGTYTINNLTDPISGLLTEIETAYSIPAATTVEAFIRDGKIYIEDTTATGSSSITLTLTPSYDGGGSGLSLGTFDQTTERDLDLGLINESITGQDVAGTINGETATGSKRLLTGDDDNINTDGLAIEYTGTSNDIDAGTIKLTLGIAELLERALYNITDSVDGYLTFKQDSLQGRVSDLGDQVEIMEARLDRKMESMINRFVAMELSMSRIQNQGDWLSGQISAAYSGWV